MIKDSVVLNAYLLAIRQMPWLVAFDVGLRHTWLDWSAGVERAMFLPLTLTLCLTYTLPFVNERSNQG